MEATSGVATPPDARHASKLLPFGESPDPGCGLVPVDSPGGSSDEPTMKLRRDAHS